jgi:hypothetical protein
MDAEVGRKINCEGASRSGPRHVGRKKKFTEQAIVRFPEGTKDRIQDALGPVEDMADLIRLAVEKELQSRQELKKKPARK